MSYEPNGAITDVMPPSVTFDSVKNEFVVPVGISSFTFNDNGVAMRVHLLTASGCLRYNKEQP